MIMEYSSNAVMWELWGMRMLESAYFWVEKYILMLDLICNVQISNNLKVKRVNLPSFWLINTLIFNTIHLLIMARRLHLLPDYVPLVHPDDHLDPHPCKFMKIHERFWFYADRVMMIISLLPYLDDGLAAFGLATQLYLALSTVMIYYLHGAHKFAVMDNEIGKLVGRENIDHRFDHHNKAKLLKLMWALRMMDAGVFWVERVLLIWALIHNINKLHRPDFVINKLWEDVSHIWLNGLLFSNVAHLFIFFCRLRFIPDYLDHIRFNLDPLPCKVKKIHQMFCFYLERLVMCISLLPYPDSRHGFGVQLAAQLFLALITTGITLYGPPKLEGESDINTSDDHNKVAMANDGFSEEDKFEETIVNPLKVVAKKIFNSGWEYVKKTLIAEELL